MTRHTMVMKTTTGCSGYRACACHDCFEMAFGDRGAMCPACESAGCYADAEFGCQAPGAYGDDDAE